MHLVNFSKFEKIIDIETIKLENLIEKIKKRIINWLIYFLMISTHHIIVIQKAFYTCCLISVYKERQPMIMNLVIKYKENN